MKEIDKYMVNRVRGYIETDEEIELEFNKILDGFSPIVEKVENKFLEHKEELLKLKEG